MSRRAAYSTRAPGSPLPGSPPPEHPAALPGTTEAALEAASSRRRKALAKNNQARDAARLAQIVNLHIAGYSLADIGSAIGSSPEEVDRLLNQDAQRYVRSQPALRNYVRGYISAKYTGLLEAVWDQATDKSHPQKLEHQDRALRILNSMGRLHGAEAPVQKEVKVETAPEAVEAVLNRIAAQQGQAYDASIFDDPDILDAEIVAEDVPEPQDEDE